MKKRLIFVALAMVTTPVFAQKAPPTKLDSAGALFGVRETVQQIDISPDGNRVVYVTPGPGRTSTVLVAELAGGTPKQVIQSGGNPDRMNWCKFVNNSRMICRIAGQVENAGVLVPFSRLIAVDADGKNIKPLAQERTGYSARSGQFDGDILDWLPDTDGEVLMARHYVSNGAQFSAILGPKEDGLGVERIDVSTMRSTQVEPANKAVDFYITDGRGHVRIKGYQPDRGATGQLSSRIDYRYRLATSQEWHTFSSWEDRGGMVPVEVDAGTNSAYVLKNLDGRLALYRVKLDGSMTSELVYKND